MNFCFPRSTKLFLFFTKLSLLFRSSIFYIFFHILQFSRYFPISYFPDFHTSIFPNTIFSNFIFSKVPIFLISLHFFPPNPTFLPTFSLSYIQIVSLLSSHSILPVVPYFIPPPFTIFPNFLNWTSSISLQLCPLHFASQLSVEECILFIKHMLKFTLIFFFTK